MSQVRLNVFARARVLNSVVMVRRSIWKCSLEFSSFQPMVSGSGYGNWFHQEADICIGEDEITENTPLHFFF
jgi:hypothetical protein